MLSAKHFTRQISVIQAALSAASAIAKAAGYIGVDFRPLQRRLHELDAAIHNQDQDAITKLITSLNAERGTVDFSVNSRPEAMRSVRSNPAGTPTDVHAKRVAAGRKGGVSKSTAKRAAARKNGALGGRPTLRRGADS